MSGVLMPGRNRAHYSGDYQRRARAVRQAANANPLTRCWRCGRTLDEHGPGVRWDAGHLRDGDPTSPLAPEASSCNRSAGAAAGNRRRRGLEVSREW
jgi:hypothetical protein